MRSTVTVGKQADTNTHIMRWWFRWNRYSRA